MSDDTDLAPEFKKQVSRVRRLVLGGLIAVLCMAAGSAVVWIGDPTLRGKAIAIGLPLAWLVGVFWPTRRTPPGNTL